MNLVCGFDGLEEEEEGCGMSREGSRSFWRNFWWREGLGEAGIGLWVWGESLGSLGGLGDEEVRWEERRRLEGENVTVAVILGVGVCGSGFKGVGEEEEEEDGGFRGLDLGAKKRDMTCCFCFPIAAMVSDFGSEQETQGGGQFLLIWRAQFRSY